MSVEGVIVAGGFSSRAGGWKMAFSIGGQTIIERSILAMAPWCSRVIVVGGYFFERLLELLPKHKYPKVDLVFNRDYSQGMFSSVLTGLRLVREARFFFAPGDYPLVSSEVYKSLLSQEGEIIIPAYQGISGHPVLFETKVIADLLAKPGAYTNLREFIAAHNHRSIEVPDFGILLDIDTKEDYWKAVQYLTW